MDNDDRNSCISESSASYTLDDEPNLSTSNDSYSVDSDGFRIPDAWRHAYRSISSGLSGHISTASPELPQIHLHDPATTIQPNNNAPLKDSTQPPPLNLADFSNPPPLQSHDQSASSSTPPPPISVPTHETTSTSRSTLPQPVIDPITRIFLEALQYVSKEDAITPQLTLSEYKGKIKVWDERTTTSPTSNMHLGHLKAYWADHTLEPESQAAKDLEECWEEILGGHLLLLNYALKFGYSYEARKTIVNTMIEKDPGSPKIHQLRVIHLYEADYNLILGVKWWELLHHAVDRGFINESQFGSQPGKEAIDAIFVRELEYKIGRLTRKGVIHFDNDASSCYDRIPCFLANVISRKYGMHRNICIVQGRTLAEAKYHLKTKLGISDDFIQHSRAFPIFGTGQGSGNSPMYWLFISSTLFDLYEHRAGGSHYSSPDGSIKTDVKIVGFVDDTRNSTNDFANNEVPLEILLNKATQDSQLWHDLLRACNQSLELSKCGYHAIMYSFQPTGEPTLETRPPSAIRLQDFSDHPIDINQWDNTTATKYLGVYKCPADQKKQFEFLLQRCNGFSRIVTCSHLTRKETKCFYWAIYRLSVNYALPTTYFSLKELNKIQAKSHASMLAKSGFNRFTSL